MERRLLLAKELLNPDDSVLIVTIDDKEYLRLGLLLEQTFPEARMHMVTSVINPQGVSTVRTTSRAARSTSSFLLMVTQSFKASQTRLFQKAQLSPGARSDAVTCCIEAGYARRAGQRSSTRSMSMPKGVIVKVGEALPHGVPRNEAPSRRGCTAVFPMRDDGTEMNWGLTVPAAESLLAKGYLRVGRHTSDKPQPWEIPYLTSGRIADIESGRAIVTARNADGTCGCLLRDSQGKNACYDVEPTES